MLYIDFETRSRCDLKKHGVYNYAQDASTEVVCMSYAFDDDEVVTWLPGTPFPEKVRNYSGMIYAHNAAFERLIFWYVLQIDFKLEQFYCTAAQSRANCGPGSLEDAGRFAGAGMRKDPRGAQLIRALSVPRADGTFNEAPKLMAEFIAYCEQDVRAMRAISLGLRALSAEELQDYWVNERINDRGVLIDVPLAKAAMQYAAAETKEIQALVAEITEGAVTSVRSPKMRGWVMARVGPEALKLMVKDDKPSIDKTIRGNLLECDDVPPEVLDVIQCADDLWASSVAKFTRMAALADVEDQRVRGAFVFAGGAATGRAACVTAETLVDTDRGKVPIAALEIGGNVLTHTGRFCRISQVIYKGREIMYRVAAKSGGWVECTGEHRLLTAEGWKHVKELIRNSRPGSASGGDAPVYLAAVPYDGAGRGDDQTDARHSQRDIEADRTTGEAAYSEGGELLQFEAGREKPDVRREEASRGNLTGELHGYMAARQQDLPSGTPRSADGFAGVGDVAVRVGGASHRQRQDKQLVGQLGNCNESWASTVALSEITEIVYVGEKGVWDITVEGDASYCAQGLIHHNSYGIQFQNLPRDCAEDPDAVRQQMVRGHKLTGTVTKVLKGMLRAAIIPAPGNVLISIDWSAIEARVNPWLSNSPLAEGALGVFRRGEDMYVTTAKAMFSVREVTPAQRQQAKVACLACGFMGGVGAFAAMGRAYGLNLPESEAKHMVSLWRKANPWAQPYWRSLEETYTRAMRNPGHEFSVGRITYMYDRANLWYILPSGRVLCYPQARFDADGGVSYAKSAWKPAQGAKEWPRARLWPGLACENVTQAVAADILRHSLRQIDTVAHIHDELILECPAGEADAVKAKAEAVMCIAPPWAEGLPLAVEGKVMLRFGK